MLIYNSADDKLVYRTGIAVFDRHDPHHLISRSDQPVLSPERDWEKVGPSAERGVCRRHGPAGG